MIELITGLPGSGKTLWTLHSVKAKSEKENRPVFQSGIPELKLPWPEIDPEKWYEAPPNSIVVIDECQRIFRPRGNGSAVPQYVSELETHRHKGIDLVFVTQHPMLIDSNVRRLVGRHFHVARRFGMQRSSVFEYESCKEQPLAKIDSATVRHEWKYPKEVFDYYKSAEVHTHKRRIPKKVYMLAVVAVLVVGAVAMLVRSFAHKIHGDVPGVAPAGEVSASQPGQKSADPFQWFKDRSPRVVGMAFTAPVYDEVTKPITAPMPVACIASKSRCVCNSQQGTRLDVPASVCRDIVAHGYFVDWRERAAASGEPQADREPQPKAPRPPPQSAQGDGFPLLPSASQTSDSGRVMTQPPPA